MTLKANVRQIPLPYVGTAWLGDMMTGPTSLSRLQFIIDDLVRDAKTIGITPNKIELWVEQSTGTKGFFAGDTSSFHERGWRKLATL